MLQYVMTKLETHNINSDGQIMPNHIEQAAEEDSGTETDDETGGPDEDTMDLTDDEGHPPRPSSTPGHALYGLDRNGSLNDFEVTSSGESSISKETPSDTTPTSATPTFFVSSCQSSDMDGGSHSSEEELEEINNIPALLPNSSSSSSAMSTPLPETTPVQFSTTPPNHVHKPRRSTSPPPCIPAQGTSLSVHEAPEAANTGTVTPSVAEVAALTHPSSNNGGGAVSVYGSGHASASVQELRSHDGNSIDRRNSLVVVERRAIASKKRYKQSRIHHIQRPCLDFEKMQLLKTRAITSWRHGGELSLFCW